MMLQKEGMEMKRERGKGTRDERNAVAGGGVDTASYTDTISQEIITRATE